MQRIITFLFLIFTGIVHTVTAQNTYIPLGFEEYRLADRLETMSGYLSNDLFLSAKPIARKGLVGFLENEKHEIYENGLSNVDNFNINRTLSLSGEWVGLNSDGAAESRRPLFGALYRRQPDMVHVNKRDFFMVINPVLSAQAIYEKDNKRNTLFSSSQGAEIRTRIADRVGAYVSFTNNYEEPVGYFADYTGQHRAVPNTGPYKRAGNGYQYLQVRGYADVALVKDHINLTVGYDKHFIGDGYRSLFISDFSAPVPFVRINTKIWRLNYQNLFMVLEPQNPANPALRAGASKYVSAHYLTANITRWLNIGFFESVTFARDGHFEFGYMNPIIFYRAVERGLGSPDKVALGFNAKAIVLHSAQLYGQFLVNEFKASEFFRNRGYMHNKWGVQAGAKYFNAFTVSNLDLQAELNMVRPYTYQHYTDANYTNYNQPFAHPLGAGFRELIVSARYQPIPRLTIDARVMYYRQGIDTGNLNYGSDIFKSYRKGSSRYGVSMINGVPVNCLSGNLNLAYELKPSLFVELGGSYRDYQYDNDIMPGTRTTYFYGGLRLNIARRDYNQF